MDLIIPSAGLIFWQLFGFLALLFILIKFAWKPMLASLAEREAEYSDEVQRLLDAGLAVMARSGTSASPRVADIVSEAQVSNDAFYRHFSSKEDLVLAVAEAGAERLVSYVSHQMNKHPDPR